MPPGAEISVFFLQHAFNILFIFRTWFNIICQKTWGGSLSLRAHPDQGLSLQPEKLLTFADAEMPLERGRRELSPERWRALPGGPRRWKESLQVKQLLWQGQQVRLGWSFLVQKVMSLLLGTTVTLRRETMCRSKEPKADRIFCLTSVWLCDGSINKNLNKPHPFHWDHYASIPTSTIRIQIYSLLLDYTTESNPSFSFPVFLQKTGRSHFKKKVIKRYYSTDISWIHTIFLISSKNLSVCCWTK